MPRNKFSQRGFALYEVLIGVTIFVIGILALGRSFENCLSTSSLTSEDNVIREMLADRMAEIQTAPGRPDASKEMKINSGYGRVELIQKSTPAGLQQDDGVQLPGIDRVTLTALWERSGTKQSRQVMFYVFRAG
jgi:Tfp pilus assembly protein PilV